jgi:PAS domain S-box-containing protein
LKDPVALNGAEERNLPAEVAAHADARYRDLFENAIVGVFQTSVDGRILWVNKAAARIVGYESAEEFMGSVAGIEEIYVDPGRRDAFVAEASTGEVHDFEYQIRRRDGEIRWISVSARTLCDEIGNPLVFEGVVVDVTQKKLVDAATAAVASELQPGRALDSFAQILKEVVPFTQFSLAVIEGDKYRRVVSVGQSPRFAEGALIPLEGNSVKVAVDTRAPVVVQDTKEGRFGFDRWLCDAGVRSYVVLPLLQREGVFGAFNIGFSAPNVPTEEMVELLSALTSAVAQGVSNILAFEHQREVITRLQELDEIKSELLSAVSHNLRTPLTTIMGAALTLERSGSNLNGAEREEIVTYLAENARKLDEMLRDLLDLDRLARGAEELHRERTDVGELVRHIVAEIDADGHNVDVDAEPISVALDVTKVRRMVENLVTNAIKHTPAGARVWVRAGAEPDGLLIVVDDDGRGVPEHLKQAIFEPFRLGTEGHHAPGTGIGLALVRRLAELHGGRAWVEDRTEGGASFRILLPPT